MDGSHVFLSYSHQQAYFAESLMLSLEQMGLPVWFDMQRLPPGIAWRQALDEGLSTCAGLVLVASRTALSSDAVRVEWEAALAANKPVYVVLFEAVHLPSALRVATIIDMRQAFHKKTVLLAETIRTGKVHRDRLPHTNPLQLPTHLPLSLWTIIAAFWLIGLLGILMSLAQLRLCQALIANDLPLNSDPLRPTAIDARLEILGRTFHGDGPTVFLVLSLTVAVWLATLLTLSVTVALLYRRRFDFVLFYAGLLMPAGYALVANALLSVVAGSPQDFGPNLPLLPLGATTPFFTAVFSWLRLAAALLSLLALAVYLRSRRSGALLRWLPTGSAPEPLRRYANPMDILLNRPKMVPEIKQTTWRLWYEPANERLARHAQRWLRTEHLIHESDSSAASLHIALVSNQSRQVWLDELSQRLPGLVCLVSTSVRIPASLAHVHQTQWLDYRERLGTQLLAMVQRTQLDPKTSVSYRYPVLPESLERNSAPGRISVAAASVRLLALASLSAVFLMRVGTTAGIPPVLAALGYVGLLPSLYVLWLADRLLDCDITWRDWRRQFFRASMLLTLGLFLFYTTHGLSMSYALVVFGFVGFFLPVYVPGFIATLVEGEGASGRPALAEDEGGAAWLPSTSATSFMGRGTLAVPLWRRVGAAMPTLVLTLAILGLGAGLFIYFDMVTNPANSSIQLFP